MLFQSPERSGLPSAVFGAGAVRLGLPSAVRGIPEVLRCSHCAGADTGIAHRNRIRAAFVCLVYTGISLLLLFSVYIGSRSAREELVPIRQRKGAGVSYGFSTLGAISRDLNFESGRDGVFLPA